MSQILNVKSHQITGHSFWLDVLRYAEVQVIVEAMSVCIHRVWGKLQVRLPLKPFVRQGVLCHERVLFPTDLSHGVPPCEKTAALFLLMIPRKNSG